MFGRRKTPFGGNLNPPPPPVDKDPFPIEKMDCALDAAIRLFTRVLDDAGVDAGKLALRGQSVPDGVGALLADCTTYRGEENGGPTYLALGITADFKAFMYPPHCRLYFILNSVGICEDPAAQSMLDQLAPGQLPRPLIDAQLMRRWIRYILPTPEAMKGGQATLEALHRQLMGDLMDVLNQVPAPWAETIDLKELFKEWTAGFPGTIGRPLTDDVERMNGLPVTPFIGETLIKFLGELQMRGISERG